MFGKNATPVCKCFHPNRVDPSFLDVACTCRYHRFGLLLTLLLVRRAQLESRKRMSLPDKVYAHFHGATVSDILHWRRPTAAGIVIGVASLIVFVSGWLQFTWVTFACRGVQLGLGILGVFSRLGALPTSDQVASKIGEKASLARPYLVEGARVAGTVLMWENWQLTFQVLFASVALAFIGNLVPDLLVFVVVVGAAFTLPTVYDRHQDAIHSQLDDLKRKTGEVVDTYSPLTPEAPRQ